MAAMNVVGSGQEWCREQQQVGYHSDQELVWPPNGSWQDWQLMLSGTTLNYEAMGHRDVSLAGSDPWVDFVGMRWVE